MPPEIEGWHRITFDTRHGLPSQRVEHLVVTPNGTVWAGTTSGLASYDGYLWHSEVGASGLPSGPTVRLAPVLGTPDEVLVVAGGGLFRGRPGHFERILGPAYHVTGALPFASIAPDSVFVVWAGRLALLEDGRLRDVHEAMGLGGEALQQVWATQPGSLWLLSQSGLLHWRQGTISRAMGLLHGERVVVDALVERAGGGGLFHLAMPLAARGVWQWTGKGPPAPLGQPGLEEATSVAAGPEFDLITQAFGGAGIRVGLRAFDQLGELHSGRVLAVAAAPDSTLWLGTERGAQLLHRGGQVWSEQILPDSLVPHRVQELARGPDGTLWAATSSGLVVLRPGRNPDLIARAAGVSLVGLTGLAIDRTGIVWVSSGGVFDGVLRYDGRRWQRVGHRDVLRGVRGHRLRLDRAGRLWVMGLGSLDDPSRIQRGGAFVLDGERFRGVGPPDSGRMGGRVYDMDEAPDGTLWFASIGGIYRLRDGVWRHWGGEGADLRQARVFTVALDREGQVWFAHQTENEIGRIGTDDRVKYFSLPPAIADTRPWTIRRGDDGRIWLAGDGGVAVLSDGVWSGLGYSEGLANTSVWPILPESDGVLFGTGRGISRLDLSLAQARPAPRVAVHLLAGPRGTLSTEFVVGPYAGWSDPDRIEIRYRLDEGGWSDWTLARRLTADHLGTGEHRVAVQAKGLLGNRGPVTAASVRVEGPVWTSWWFLVPATLAVLLLAGGILLWLRARRREAQLALEVAEAYRDLYRAAPDGYVTETIPGRIILEGNERAARIFGYDPARLPGVRLEDHIRPASREVLARATEALLATGDRQEMEVSAQRCDGTVFDMELSTSTVRSADGHVIRGRTILRDVSARKAAERDLSLFRLTLETSFEPALWLRPDGEVMYANAAACRLLRVSREQVLGRPAEAVWPAAAALFATLRERLGEKISTLFEADFVFTDGGRMPVEVAASMTAAGDERYLAIFVRDITERRAQEALRQELEARGHAAERLQSLGTLAGGVAHEFNNLLAVILGYSDLLRESAPDRESAGLAEELTRAATRGRDLVAQILRFSARGREARTPITLSRFVADALAHDRVALPSRVTLATSLRAEGPVLGAATELHSVIENLVKNAAEAYGPAGGVVRVSTRNLVVTEAEAKSRGVREGRYLQLSVEDDAGGMPPEVAHRVFEPFFTTKRTEGGTGLGLSVVHGVVTSHGGAVAVESHVGRGTRFEVLLPETAIEPGEPAPQPAVPGPTAGKGYRILLVEDQAPVLQVACRQLNRLGCVTTGFQSPSAAMNALAADPRGFDLLLTDLAMPEMSGLEVARAARRIRSDLPVLVASGYVEAHMREDLLAAGVARILPKPYTLDDLTQALKGFGVPTPPSQPGSPA